MCFLKYIFPFQSLETTNSLPDGDYDFAATLNKHIGLQREHIKKLGCKEGIKFEKEINTFFCSSTTPGLFNESNTKAPEEN